MLGGRRSLLLLLAVLAVFAAAASYSHRTARELRADASEIERHILVPSPFAARIVSMGYTEMAADLAWVRMLVYYGDGIVNKTGMPDTEALVRLVNVLDPYFRKAYIWGAYATTLRGDVGTDAEYYASIDVVRRGLEKFPNDWEMNWILGIRLYMFIRGGTPEDMQRRRNEGAMYIERAMHSPNAPADLPILAASLRTQLGQKEQALRDLREMILITDDEKARAKLQEQYAALVSETAGHELVDAAAKFDAERKQHLPYAAPSWFVLLGPPPPQAFGLDETVRGPTIEDGTLLAP